MEASFEVTSSTIVYDTRKTINLHLVKRQFSKRNSQKCARGVRIAFSHQRFVKFWYVLYFSNIQTIFAVTGGSGVDNNATKTNTTLSIGPLLSVFS